MNDNTPNPEIIEEESKERLSAFYETTPINLNYTIDYQYSRLSEEGRERIAELFEAQIQSEDPDKDLPTIVKALIRHSDKRPDGEPPEISKEERAEILEYYKNGETGEKPANADRFELKTHERSWVDPRSGETMQKRRTFSLTDKDKNEWQTGPAAEWLKKGRAIAGKINDIRYTIISEATKEFLGQTSNEIMDKTPNPDLDKVLIYMDIYACVDRLLDRKINEIEAAFIRRSEAAKAGQVKKKETEARTRELEAAATRELFAPISSIMANDTLLDAILSLNPKGATLDPATKILTWEVPTGKLTAPAEDFEKLTTNDYKLWDTAKLYLTKHNPDKTNDPCTEIILDIDEYAAERNVKVETQKQRDRFIADLRASVKTLAQFHISGDIKKGPNKGHFIDLGYVQHSTNTSNGAFHFWVDSQMAKLLMHAGKMSYPTAFQAIAGKNPNAYPVAVKFAFHNSNLDNIEHGRQNSLGVASIINAAPQIPTFEELAADGNNARAWKRLIKTPVERAIESGPASPEAKNFIKRWEYRDPETGITYTPEQANTLPASIYKRLKVDFVTQPDEAKTTREREALIRKKDKATTADKPKKKTRPKAKKPDA